MKTLKTLLLICISIQLFAQNAEDCNGDRYVNKIFPETTKTTVIYGSNIDAQGEFQTLTMDIYEPLGDDAIIRPAIVLAHGGSFIQGTKSDSDMVTLCEGFAKRGYVAASIDYRLFTLQFPNFPDSLTALDIVIKTVGDMKAAVRHLRKDAATENLFDIDSERIFIGGASAGAITALHHAYMSSTDSIPDYLTEIIEENGGFEGDTGDEENRAYSSEALAVFNLSGGIYRADWLSENEPPLVSYHGTEDDLVPYGVGTLGARFNDFQIQLMTVFGSGSIHAQADEVGLSNYLKAIEGGGHEEIYGSDFQLDLDEFSYQSLLFYHDILCEGVEVSPSATNDIIAKKIALKVYPNPAQDFVFVEINATLKADKILVYNELGILVGEEKIREEKIKLMKNNYGNGLFYFQLINEKGMSLPHFGKVVFTK